MNKTVLSTIHLLTIMLLCFSRGYSFVEISLEKDAYLKYEPVYLEITYDLPAAPAGFYISGLIDKRAMIGLVIISPAGEKNTYRAPLRVLNVKENVEYTFYETLLFSRNSFLFEMEGAYELFLVDVTTGAQVSNRKTITVRDGAEANDRYIQKQIEKDPMSYAMFVYLKGGDQFKNGLAVVREMVEKRTGFHTVASAILAINASQIKWDTKNNKLERDRDADAVEKFFPDVSGRTYVPKYLKLEASRMVLEQFSDAEVTAELRRKIKDVARQHDKEIKNSEKFQGLKQM